MTEPVLYPTRTRAPFGGAHKKPSQNRKFKAKRFTRNGGPGRLVFLFRFAPLVQSSWRPLVSVSFRFFLILPAEKNLPSPHFRGPLTHPSSLKPRASPIFGVSSDFRGFWKRIYTLRCLGRFRRNTDEPAMALFLFRFTSRCPVSPAPRPVSVSFRFTQLPRLSNPFLIGPFLLSP